MKLKRFATVVQTACLLWFTAREAQAFYNPSTGRWLSRDPIGEKGGMNLSSFVLNDLVNQQDFLGLDIVCKCPQEYFAENGIGSEMYEDLGEDRYRAKEGFEGPASGVGEILWKMLQDSRNFTAAARSVTQLKLHVTARQNVVKSTQLVFWGFPTSDRSETFSSKYWTGRLRLKDDASPSVALNDVFRGGIQNNDYSIGCNASSMLVLLMGVKTTIGPKLFDAAIRGQPTPYIDGAAIRSGLIHSGTAFAGGKKPTLKDWVPGDRGNVQGEGTGLNAGEWLIHLGNGDRFWGMWPVGDGERIRTIQEWTDDMSGGGSGVTGKRTWPGVGLERNR